VHVVEIGDVPDDVLEEANAARYQMLTKKSKWPTLSKRIGKTYDQMKTSEWR
jgi:hypothetical protein